ncbi:hypothetical protein B0H34DRAFT_799386 [Crassisporium funariophilum]|nr:hypothetical protein B0H34DRAFT_799386 [Crassisporium funariophilum]
MERRLSSALHSEYIGCDVSLLSLTGFSSSSRGGGASRTLHREHSHTSTSSERLRVGGGSMDVDLTDEEDHEAITPPSTWGKGDARWVPGEGGGGATTLPKGVDDDDMFKAALALCGLGRRT